MKPKMQLTDKNNGQDDPCMHLAKWMQAYGEKTQLEWVHHFCHTLDVITMNCYTKIELRHEKSEWDILHKGFLMTFSFEDGFDNIDEALQEVKVVILRIPQNPLDLIRPEWATQLSHVLEFYNVTAEDEDEDPRKINIPKTKSHYGVQGP